MRAIVFFVAGASTSVLRHIVAAIDGMRR